MSTPLKFEDFFILRTPLLPLLSSTNINRSELYKFYQNHDVEQALYVASPNLHNLFKMVIDGKIIDKDKIHKIEIALCKYALRMSYRCTPFGLFAGVSLGHWSNENKIELDDSHNYIVHKRLDTKCSYDLASFLNNNEIINSSILYYPNNTLYKTSKNARYIEYQLIDGKRSYSLESIELNLILRNIFKVSKKGITKEKLIDYVLSINPFETRDNVTKYIHDVINSQLLVSEFEISITGRSYSEKVLNKAKEYYLKPINELYSSAEELSIFSNNIQEYTKNIHTYFDNHRIPYDKNHILQVDLFKPLKINNINSTLQDDIIEAIKLLSCINNNNEPNDITIFRNNFIARYEKQEISLMEAIDPEKGLGYPISSNTFSDKKSLIKNINDTKYKASNNFSSSNKNNEWEKFILNKYITCLKNKQRILDIRDTDISNFIQETYYDELPISLYSIGNVIVDDDDKVKFVHRVSAGPSALSLIGRFCHLDKEIYDQSIKTASHEELLQQDCIFAEIIHVDQPRIGNISTRPTLRKYEIPILANPGLELDNVIPIDDLFISVQSNNIVLRSKRLNKTVIPRLSCAHNHALSPLPIYRFLVELQYQNIKSKLIWNWGLLEHAKYLPRVTYKNTILFSERWILDYEDIQKIHLSLSAVDLMKEVHKLSLLHDIHDNIIISQGDNKIPLNLKNELHCSVLKSLIKKNEKLVIEENLFNTKNLFVRSKMNLFTNEFIFPILNQKSKLFELSKKHSKSIINTQRFFPPSSDWLFIKIYCNSKLTDTILNNKISSIVAKLIKSSVISEWFFIRYNDPNHHLRIRFLCNNGLYHSVIDELNKKLSSLINKGFIHNIEISTYKRELERYGFNTINYSEKLFHIESEVVIKILRMTIHSNNELLWLCAFRSLDSFLNNFRLNVYDKYIFATNSAKVLKNSLDLTSHNKEFGLTYRERKDDIVKFMSDQSIFNKNSIEFKLINVIKNYNNKSRVVIDKILQKIIPHEQLINFINSHTHMFINRIFNNNQLEYEVVIYDMMAQYYQHLIKAKNKHIK